MSPQALILDDVAGNLVECFVRKCSPGLACTVVKSVTDLRAELQRQPFPQFHWLFLNVHFGLGTQLEGGILPVLEELVTKGKSALRLILYGFETDRKRAIGRSVTEHPLLTAKFLDTWIYMPMPSLLEEMKAAMSQAEQLDQKLWPMLRSAVAQARASRLDRDIRHKLAGATAAARIVHGALRSGDYDVSDTDVRRRLDQAFTALLGSCVGIEFDDLKTKIEELIIAAQAGAQNVEERPEKTRRSQAKKGKTQHQEHQGTGKKELLSGRQLLIVDDEQAVWEPVWKFLLNTDTVAFAATGTAALEKVKSCGTSYDAVILDLDLGKANTMNGVEVLQRIKHTHLDLPVIVATATHHAEFAKQCMRLGASGYFLKELVETVKDSPAYYETLKRVVTSQLPATSPERKIWQRFLKIQDKVDAVDKTCKTTIGPSFRKAYYLLTLEKGYILPSTLLVPQWLGKNPTTQYDGAIFQGMNAADQTMIAYVMIDRTIAYDAAQTMLYQVVDVKSGKPRYPSFEERCKRAKPNFSPEVIGACLKSKLSMGSLRHYFAERHEEPSDKPSGVEALARIIHDR